MIYKRKQKHITSSADLQKQFEKTKDQSFFNHGHFQLMLNQQHKLLMTYLNITKTDSILDIASGFGFQLSKLSQYISSGLGIDWSSKMIRQSNEYINKENISNIEFKQMDIKNLNQVIPKQYSKIYTIGAFEHFQNHKAICRDIYQILIKNGKFMIMTQNRRAFWHQLSIFFSRGLKHYSSDTFFTSKELKHLLKNSGFHDIKISYWNFVPQGDISFPFNKLFVLAQAILGAFLPEYFKGGILIVGKK